VPQRDHGDAQLLELVGQVMGLLELDEFRPGVLHALHEAVPSTFVSLNEMTPDAVIVAIVEPPVDPAGVELWGQLAHENPLYQNFQSSGEGRAYRFSDVTTREQLEATRLFQEFYLPLGVHHQIAFTLPSDARRILAIALSRGGDDYSDAERDFLDRARPFLIQAYRNALAHSTRTLAASDWLAPALVEAGLTAREAEVMRVVAHGASSGDAGRELGISERTVDKHLEHVFAKLGVATRSAASARAWELAGDDDHA
jgi:DNA-binding CsgD family transcriptional regulator